MYCPRNLFHVITDNRINFHNSWTRRSISVEDGLAARSITSLWRNPLTPCTRDAPVPPGSRAPNPIGWASSSCAGLNCRRPEELKGTVGKSFREVRWQRYNQFESIQFKESWSEKTFLEHICFPGKRQSSELQRCWCTLSKLRCILC